MKAGRIVQTVSMVCASNVYRLVNEFIQRENIAYPTNVTIRVITAIAWSWKKISWAISGEAASCSPS